MSLDYSLFRSLAMIKERSSEAQKIDEEEGDLGY